MARSGGTGDGKGRAAKPARSSLRRHFESAVPTLLVVVLIVLFWEFFNVSAGEPEYVLPPLHKILATVIDRAGDRFLPASWVTLQEMLLGFAFGVGSGAVLGTLIFHFKTMRRALLPIVSSTQAVPSSLLPMARSTSLARISTIGTINVTAIAATPQQAVPR